MKEQYLKVQSELKQKSHELAKLNREINLKGRSSAVSATIP
jgi:hypothetical protein